MDIYCPKCGEPWDHDEFHYAENDLTYKEAKDMFRKKGCGPVFNATCIPSDSLRAQASSVLMDIMPDDMDGVASMLDDFGYVGMLD